MDKKKLGSAFGVAIVAAAVLAGMKHSTLTPAPDPAPAPEPASATVEIVAPTSVKVGELVVLSVEDSDARSFTWQVVPPTKHFMVIDGGKRAVFSSPDAGAYLFIVGAAKADSVDLKTHKLMVKSDEKPVPAPAPAPGSALAAKVRALADAVNSPAKKAEAAKLSHAFAGIAAAVSAGAISDPADIVSATKEATKTSLGTSLPAWTSFLQGLQSELKVMADAGKLPDAKAHAATWDEIAKALQAFAGSP